MADPILRGSSSPIVGSQVIESSPVSGYTLRQSFSGTDSNQMVALMYEYIRAGVSTALITEGGITRLETNDATQQYVLDIWQIVGNEESRDIFEHPTIGAILDDDEVAAIRAGIETLTAADAQNGTAQTIAGMIDDAAPGLSAPNAATVARFVGLYIRGTTHYRRQQYVLRHTTNAPSNWGTNIADAGVDQIYTPDLLLAEISSSSLWDFPAPNRILTKIADIPEPSDRDNYLWGWLKAPSTETTAANNRIEINQEYCLEMWSTDLYEVYTP